jgi:hypothetical protein
MFDPFVEANPPVLVHEVDGSGFEATWNRLAAGDDAVQCPVCGRPGVTERGTSPRTNRSWIRFACGDVVAQEVNAG